MKADAPSLSRRLRTSCGAIALLIAATLVPSAVPAQQSPSIAELEAAAQQGDATALDRLAYAYWRGRGVEADVARAEELYRSAVDAGRTRSLVNLGRLLGEEGEAAEALAALTTAVEQGVTGAETWLAIGHTRGLFGDASDPDIGVALLTKGHDAGDDRASFALADALDGGGTVEPDPERAAVLYGELADKGDARALDRLGYMAWRGIGMAPDLGKAEGFLRDAIAAGRSRSQINLARVLIEADRGEEAHDLLQAAIEAGLEGGDFWLARGHARGDFGARTDRHLGLADLERLSASGQINATLDLARIAGRKCRSIALEPVAERLETASAEGSGSATEALVRLLRECPATAPASVKKREALIEERGTTMRDQMLLQEEVWLASDTLHGKDRLRHIADLVEGASGDTFARGLRAAYSADRRAYTWILQQTLIARGFYGGTPNGLMTTNTIKGFRRLCRAEGIDSICTHGPLRSDAVTALSPILEETF